MLDSLDFLHTVRGEFNEALKTVDFFSSHEGLILEYESALTRQYEEKWYNQSAHFLWIGDRTRNLGGAHIDYFTGISNPIGVKVGPSMKPDELVQLVKRLNPTQEPGRLTLITRYGAEKVQDSLPSHIAALKAARIEAIWCCDPMHGNTELSSTGVKTRRFEKILAVRLHRTVFIHTTC